MCPQHDAPLADRSTTPSVAPSADKAPRLDAGTKHYDLYAQRLSPWQNALRKQLMPIVRWETPYLAWMQDTLRSPALDSYFAFTANLGTHTFFMIFLPILFWCGYTSLGRAMVHMLAGGVFWSGFVKDMLCIPRPLSPPLYRITSSPAVALEYGLPSTHSANAVSAAFYAIHMLHTAPDQDHPNAHLALQGLFYFYAVSITFGRLYCGMHGFLDVAVGSLIGALLAWVQLLFGESFDHWMTQSYMSPLIATLIVLVLCRIHPEPADDCPCYDDTVSFMGVVIGINVGAWHFAQTAFSTDFPIPSTVPFDLKEVGLVKASIRIALGVVIVFVWRATMKPILFKILPPIFRVLEHARLNLPRAFFLNASKYTSVPPLRGDDNVIPSARDVPQMLKNLAHPRKRSVSVGPQSAADAYETLAYRNRRRRESINSLDGAVPEGQAWSPVLKEKASGELRAQPGPSYQAALGSNLLPTPISSRVHSYEYMMGTGVGPMTPITPPESTLDFTGEAAVQSPVEEENEKREIFELLTKPRVRYDVEVINKLIVYTGIGWLAVEGNPMLFEVVGLGTGYHR
ncbi:hypothetical protein BDV96DRAFT_564202 [Lophiotrema nucula]|uniref:Phosphatidic acid phosphatase type 2/haloperoxidase domain-containing protein n=1 Tax=Lophiotrema nucula TaxID=690887 RepID=A0A6A5ZT26_9PLEO|nr:hypothetical protein BDV96DRAFT_564202 [Lophiotrema nucula]